jgi:putative acetyltransferase
MDSAEGVPGVGIHPETRSEFPAIKELVARAFGSPVEAELVGLIRESSNYVPELSLVAEKDDRVVGHVMLSYTDLRDGPRTHRVLTLSPVAVDPAAQGKGIGSALIREALQLADRAGRPLVCLEGSPTYYGRFGFTDARDSGIHFPLPDWAPRDAGQVYKLSHYDASIKGEVVYPPAFAAAEELRSRMSQEDRD